LRPSGCQSRRKTVIRPSVSRLLLTCRAEGENTIRDVMEEDIKRQREIGWTDRDIYHRPIHAASISSLSQNGLFETTHFLSQALTSFGCRAEAQVRISTQFR
jgi:hypothetical protein